MPRRFLPALEPLSERLTPTVTAVFSAAVGVLTVTGDAGDNQITVGLDTAGTVLVNGGNVAIEGGAPAVANVTALRVLGLAGDDLLELDEANGALPAAEMRGGAGDDSLLGGAGVDDLIGGAGNDLADGNKGNDRAFLGTGNDVFVWDPGEGSDLVEGQDGRDRMVFNGSGSDELFEASANGDRLRFTRDVGSIVMDVDGVERVDVNALGGKDTVGVNDLAATDVDRVVVNLAGPADPAAGDGAADHVIVNGTGGDDDIEVSGDESGIRVTGLAAEVILRQAELSNDELIVEAHGGDDIVDASGLADVLLVNADGGDGDDRLTGGDGLQVFDGGNGDDRIEGGAGSDFIFLGAGDDRFIWNAGDGGDNVQGEGGNDLLRLNGSAAKELFGLTATTGGLALTLPGGEVLSAGAVERVDLRTGGGADSVIVSNLAGSSVIAVDIDLGGDGKGDLVALSATAGADLVQVTGGGGEVSVTGLVVAVNVTGAGASDRLGVNLLGGNDTFDASTLPAGSMSLFVEGGTGNDSLTGEGADHLRGDTGDDVLSGGRGTDQLNGGPGLDTGLGGESSDSVEK